MMESFRRFWTLNWRIGALLLIITGAGLALRLVDLTGVPTGLHGDEAIVGMEGQRVLREVFIAPYSWSALGQPAAPFYLAAITVWIWDNTVLAVRMSAVISGTLLIPVLYLAVRRNLDESTAILSASLLAVMGWHIHFSRIAFPLPAWPLWVAATAGMLGVAAERRTPAWWAVSGVMAGAGIYIYNAHPLTLLILSIWTMLWLAQRIRIQPRESLINGAAFFTAMLVSLLPMLWFVLNNTQRYLNSITRHSVRDSAEWRQLDGPLSQGAHLAEQYLLFWARLSFTPRVDSVDASGVTEVVPVMLLALGISGLVIGLTRHRSPIVQIGAMIVVFCPLATVLTEQGDMRRTLVMAPFLAMFSAIAVAEVVRIARERWRRTASWAVVGFLAIALSSGVITDLHNYFWIHARAPVQHWVFAEDFHEASVFMRSLDDEDYVYFMSERWSIDYEPRRFLAPDTRGEDRSREFGELSIEVDRERGRPVFILVGDYRQELEALQQTYPGGEVAKGLGSRSGSTAFVAYFFDD
jgi:hypothetical protein